MSRNAVVRGQEVELNPALLFMRVTCVITDRAEMANNLEFEFSKQAPALFEKCMMRKFEKSISAPLMKPVNPSQISAPGSHFAIDGGYMLYVVQWPNDCTHDDSCEYYAVYVINTYGENIYIYVVFDGYSDTSVNTKTSEQQRRASRVTSADIVVSHNTQVCVKQRFSEQSNEQGSTNSPFTEHVSSKGHQLLSKCWRCRLFDMRSCDLSCTFRSASSSTWK